MLTCSFGAGRDNQGKASMHGPRFVSPESRCPFGAGEVKQLGRVVPALGDKDHSNTDYARSMLVLIGIASIWANMCFFTKAGL